MNRPSTQKINKETEAWNDTLDQMDLIDIFRVFYYKAPEYENFSSEQGMFPRIDHMWGHKTSLHKFKSEIISSVFSEHNAMKLAINHKNSEKHAKTWKLNNMSLNNEWVNN